MASKRGRTPIDQDSGPSKRVRPGTEDVNHPLPSHENDPLTRKLAVKDTNVVNSNYHDLNDDDFHIQHCNDIDGPPHDDEVDKLRYFKQNGERRAIVESNRAWNFVCTYEGCNARFNRSARLEEHIRSHNNERPWACDECEKSFIRKDHLQTHILSSHKKDERPHACEWEGCGKRFTTKSKFTVHMKKVHENKFYCTGYPPCKEIFRRQHTLDKHIKVAHLSLFPFPCNHVDPETGEACTSGYNTAQDLRGHKRKNHQPRQTIHFCVACPGEGSEVDEIRTEDGGVIKIYSIPLSFKTREELTAHTHAFHPPQCTLCGRTFNSQARLSEHIGHDHTDNPPEYSCPYDDCWKTFKRTDYLRQHVRTVHNKVLKYVCETGSFEDSRHPELRNWDGTGACGFEFGTKNTLEGHVRSKHLNLGNRKQIRKEAKTTVPKPKSTVPAREPSTLRLLTGTGDNGGRDVLCTVKDCGREYMFEHHLRHHLQKAHAFEPSEVEEHIITSRAMRGDAFWVRGRNGATSVQPSVPQTPEPTEALALSNTLPLTTAESFKDHNQLKTLDPALTAEEEEEALMDEEMGLTGVPFNINTGLPF